MLLQRADPRESVAVGENSAVARARATDLGPLRLAISDGSRWSTVVGIEGGFSRRLGAQLAVAGGRAVGDLADHCLEAAIVAELGKSEPRRVLRFGRGSPFVDIRLACHGGVDVLVDPDPDRALLQGAMVLADARRSFTLALPLTPDESYALVERDDADRTSKFLIEYLPPLRLVVVGHGSELDALVRLARAAGIEVSAMVPHGLGQSDVRIALGQAPDFPIDARTAIVVLFHDHEWERMVLPWALESAANYVGVLGSRTAHRQRTTWLEAKTLAPLARAKLRAPVGLVQATRTPETLAISILAEIIAFDEGEMTAATGHRSH